MDGVRRDVNKDIVNRLTDKGIKVETVEWWTLLGAREEMKLSEIRRLNCVDDDNMHLRWKANKDAAEMLFRRMTEIGRSGTRWDLSGKRKRLQ